MARMAQGTPLKYKDCGGTPIKVGDTIMYEGKTFTISPYGSALLTENNVAYPLSKMESSKLTILSEAAAKEPTKQEAKEESKEEVLPVTPSDDMSSLSLYSDDEIARELRKRGFHGVIEKTINIGEA